LLNSFENGYEHFLSFISKVYAPAPISFLKGTSGTPEEFGFPYVGQISY